MTQVAVPAAGNTSAPSGIEAPERIGLLMPTVIVGLGGIMVALSGSALNTALPTLTRVFDVTPAEVAWVTLSWNLTSAVFLTIFGRLSDMTGRKRLYFWGIALSLGGSVLAALSGNFFLLVSSRVLQGIGGSMSAANSLAYLVDIYPVHRRGFLVGAFEACIAIGLGVGPVIGGFVLDSLGWQWVMLIQAPFAIAILLLIPKYMKEPVRPRRAGRKFDFIGAILFAGALAPLMYALTAAPKSGVFSPIILACFAVSLVSLPAFLYAERRIADPMVDLGLFNSRAFSAGNLAKVTSYFSFAAISFLMPFYWDRVLGFSPAQLGFVLTAYPVGMLVGSLVCGPLSDRVGTRILAPAGMVIVAGVAIFQTFVTAEMGAWPVFLSAALAGLGIGSFIAPNDSAILSVSPRDRIGIVNSIMSLSRSIGGLLGAAIVAGFLSARLIANGGAFVPSYHESFTIILVVALIGAVLAWIRDPGQKDTGLHH